MTENKNLTRSLLILLAVVGACVSIAYIYVHFFVKDYTTGMNYIDNQVGLDIIDSNDLSDEEKAEYMDRYFLEANFYSNSKNNGIALQELRLNYFSDFSLTSSAYRSSGMQYLGDLKQEDLVLQKTSSDEAQKYQPDMLTYYDTTDDISWSGNKLMTPLNRDTNFTIKIDNRPFQIQLTGTKTWTTYERQWWSLWLYNKPIENILYYTYINVFADCMEAIRSNGKGYGDYYIIVDLSEYFSIKEYDSESGKFKEDDVTDIIKNYSVLKFHYDANGAVRSSQSIFKSIDCDSSYDATNADTSYWQERMVYNIDENALKYVYSKKYNGYLIEKSSIIENILSGSSKVKFNISIDLQSDFFKSNNMQVVGFVESAFENIEVGNLSIVGTEQNFYMLDKCFYNSNVDTFTYSNALTLIKGESAIDARVEVSYEMV